MSHGYDLAKEARRANELATARNCIEARKASAMDALAKATGQHAEALVAALEAMSKALARFAEVSPKLDALNKVLGDNDADEVEVTDETGREFSLVQTLNQAIKPASKPNLWLIPKEAIADLTAPTVGEISGAIKDGSAVRIDGKSSEASFTPEYEVRKHQTAEGIVQDLRDINAACRADCRNDHVHIASWGTLPTFWRPGPGELYRETQQGNSVFRNGGVAFHKDSTEE